MSQVPGILLRNEKTKQNKQAKAIHTICRREETQKWTEQVTAEHKEEPKRKVS